MVYDRDFWVSLTTRSNQYDSCVYVDNYVEIGDFFSKIIKKSTFIPPFTKTAGCDLRDNRTEVVNLVM